jgi:S-adenosylmethionine hydrolase
VWAADRPDLYLDSPGATFHGRDRFAPLASALLRGEPPSALGAAITDPVPLPRPAPRREGPTLFGTVVHIDRFGNLVTDIPTHWLPSGALRVEVGGHSTQHRADHYAGMPVGEPSLVAGSLGTAELSVPGESLSRLWRLERGAQVRIEPGRR